MRIFDKNKIFFQFLARSRGINSQRKMKKSLFLFLTCLITNLVIAQKCSKVQDSRNVTEIVECINVSSMNDIASEIKSDWSYVRIINRATHTEFSNTAGNGHDPRSDS